MGCISSKTSYSNDNSLHSFHSHHSIDKIRVEMSTRVLIVGDSRVKVATATVLKQILKLPQYSNRELNVYICTKVPDSNKMNMIKKDGIDVIEGEMSDSNSLTKAIKKCSPDTIFIVTPSSPSRVNETMSLIQQCKRSGVGHIILLSTNSIEISQLSIFGEQFLQIENFLKLSGLSYTIVRIPMYLDNYLSQLDSIATYGIFYQPLAPFCEYSSIAIIDIAEVVAKIILRPGKYADAIVTLNGPSTSGSSAAEAFSAALGKNVTYEQISYQSFRDCLLMSNINEWQAKGMIELFQIYEENEDMLNTDTKVLQDILGRQPTDIVALAKAAVDDSGLGVHSNVKISPRDSYKFNANIRVTKFSPQFNQWPAGCVGILKVTMILVKNQKLKSSLKTSSRENKVDNSSPGSTKRKGVRFFSDSVNDQFESPIKSKSSDSISPYNEVPDSKSLDISKEKKSFTDEDIEESQKKRSPITSKPNPLIANTDNFDESRCYSEDLNTTTEAEEPMDTKFLEKIKVEGKVLKHSLTDPESPSIRERFNSLDSDSGVNRRNSFECDTSPKITFGDQIHGFHDDEDGDKIVEELSSREYVTLHLHSKFVILLEGNITFIPVHTYTSGVMKSSSAPVGTSVQSAKKQLFGMTSRVSEENSPSMVMVTHTIGSVENKSFLLKGYSITADKRNPLRITINGLKDKGKLFFLDTSNEEDHHRWMQCLHSHIEFEDNKFDNVNTWIM